MAETTINGTVEDSKGGPLSGYAEFTATAVVADGTALVPNVKVTVPVSAGVVEPTPIRSTEDGWRYTVTVYAQNGPKTVPVHTLRNVAISGASVALSQLLPALPAIPQSNADVLAAQIATKLDEETANSTYARVAGDNTAPHVQLGPTTETLNSGTAGEFPGVLALRNTDPGNADGSTRLYLVPRTKGSLSPTGYSETAGLKIFGDPYFDGAGYRDLGIVFAPAWKENAPFDTGTHGTGAFWINSKVGPTAAGAPDYWAKNPDIGFSFQDGTFIAGRFSYVVSADGQTAWTALVVGSGKPDIATRSSVIKLEVQGDLAFNGAGRSVRWYRTATAADNTIELNQADMAVMLASTYRFRVRQNGNVVLGNGTSQAPTNAQSGFLHLWSMAGAPSGTPATETGSVPITIDTASSKLWAYIGGTWKGVTLA